MSWKCLGCGVPCDDMDQAACPSCGRKRDLSRRPNGAPVRPIIFALPSRTGGAPHVLTVVDRRTVLCSCTAAKFGNECHRVRQVRTQLLRHQDREVAALLTTHDRVWNLLQLFPETRDSDLRLFVRYFEYWHHLPDDLSWRGFLDFLIRTYGRKAGVKGNHLERIRRVRAHIQNVEHEFAPDAETGLVRAANEEAYTGFFGGSTG